MTAKKFAAADRQIQFSILHEDDTGILKHVFWIHKFYVFQITSINFLKLI